MKKIEGYDLVNEAGEFKILPAGVYKLKIKEVIDVPEREYLDIHFDIIDGEYKDYFSLTKRGFGSSIRSYRDSALPFFKAFISAVEKTNEKTGYKWNWDEKTLAGKYVIGIFGEEEYLDNGEVKTSTKLTEFRSAQAFKDGKCSVPPIKRLPQDQIPVKSTSTDDTIIVPDDDLPF